MSIMVKKANSRFDFQFNHELKIKSKRSQFKIQQMAFMIIAVVLLFILVIMFFLVLQSKNLRQMANQAAEERTIQIAGYVSSLTEFSCQNEEYCIDTDRLMIVRNNSVYKDFWPVAFIKVIKIYPESGGVICNKANYPNCDVYNVYENKKIKDTSSAGRYVALCRHERVNEYPVRICELGRISIGYEVKNEE